MPRKKNTVSKEALELFETLKANIESRLNALGVTPYRASRYSGHNGTWISDCFRREQGVSLAWLADVAGVLNVPAAHLLNPTDTFSGSIYDPPEWMKNIESL